MTATKNIKRQKGFLEDKPSFSVAILLNLI